MQWFTTYSQANRHQLRLTYIVTVYQLNVCVCVPYLHTFAMVKLWWVIWKNLMQLWQWAWVKFSGYHTKRLNVVNSTFGFSQEQNDTFLTGPMFSFRAVCISWPERLMSPAKHKYELWSVSIISDVRVLAYGIQRLVCFCSLVIWSVLTLPGPVTLNCRQQRTG